MSKGLADWWRCEGPDSRQAVWGRRLLFLVLAGLLVAAIYANTFNSPFIFDDWHSIEGNPHIRITSLAPAGLREAAFGSPLPTRPLANLSFALNYLPHGYRVFGYHLVNILIHLSCGLLVYLLLDLTLQTRALRDRRRDLCLWPMVAALVWLVHPLHTQSVTYLVQRMNSLAALFSLLALFCYAKARIGEKIDMPCMEGACHAPLRIRRSVYFAGAVLAWLGACASKENAAILPILVLLYNWFFIEDLRTDWLKRRWLVWAAAALVLVAVVGLVVLGRAPWQAIQSSYAIRDFSMAERLLTQPRVVFFYLSLLLVPHPARLNLDHDFPISHGLFEPATTVLALAGLVSLVVLAGYAARRHRLAAFAIFWFLGNLVIESSVIGLEMVFEHRTYLPSVFVVAALVALPAPLLKVPGRAVLAVLAVLGVLSLWTFQRNRVWQDEITLRQDCLAKSPLKPRNHAILASVHERRGNLAQAAEHYRSALRLSPDNREEILYNLGNVLLSQGDPGGAVDSYRQSLAINPTAAVVRLNLGVAFERLGDPAAAQAEYEELLGRNPGFARGHNNLGHILMDQGRYSEALGHFEAALKLRPDYATARQNRLKVLTLMRESQLTR